MPLVDDQRPPVLEMDEFFNFHDASEQHQSYPVEPLRQDSLNAASTDLELNQTTLDDSFLLESSLVTSHETSAFEPLNLAVQPEWETADLDLMSPADFTDFPRWIDGFNIPANPCDYCFRMRIHCKVRNEGVRKGSCTSCVALSRPCSLIFHTQGPHEPMKSLLTSTVNHGDTTPRLLTNTLAPDPCSHCCSRGDRWQCYVTLHGENAGRCTDCVAAGFECSLRSSNPFVQETMEAMTTKIYAPTPQRVPVATRSGSIERGAEISGETGPKIGARFSREALRTLRSWLSLHHLHPYPTDEEKESLQRQTGLNKTQITNWLANARRRGKVQAPRSTSPSVRNYPNALDIPRRATPALENMNPMERWQHSPPENEPAEVAAIAKAVTMSSFSSDRDSPYPSRGHTEDGSNRSVSRVSSASSLGTSGSSGGSFASAFSYKSQKSRGSFGSFGNRGRRRRRKQAPAPSHSQGLINLVRTFQCTFCTETFKTKHDWQRHEKSLHLSLERWVCCPDGHLRLCKDYDHMACVYCGLPNPPKGHEEDHNHSACTEKSLEERTFYRKDHFRQHLNLIHGVKFQSWSMEDWKVVTPQIRSRCGFCGIVMDSWSIRVDHLAEHFKGGKSMADWKGDWGFEQQVLDVVENGMPPYLIHDERNSSLPYEASKVQAATYRTTEDFVKLGLVDYMNDRVINGILPTDDDLIVEARKIMEHTDSRRSMPVEQSWFRDLIYYSGDSGSDGSLRGSPGFVSGAAQRLPRDMNGDPKETALNHFVQTRQMLGLTPTDTELQIEACRILDEAEKTSNFKCESALGWFKYLISASPIWLEEFRRRAKLPRSDEMAVEHIRPSDNKTIDHSILNYSRLENALIQYVQEQLALGIKPTDAELQHEARMIIYGNDDTWNQTAADDPGYLQTFKRLNGLLADGEQPDLPIMSEAGELGMSFLAGNLAQYQASPLNQFHLHWDLMSNKIGSPSVIPEISPDVPQFPLHALSQKQPSTDLNLSSSDQHTVPALMAMNQPSTNTNPALPLRYFLNDANCYGRLMRELSRFVLACMSSNNPAQHVPTDAEIQNQARWIIYDDDDPWNQTAADNEEWLIRFKRSVKLAPDSDGPALPYGDKAWNVKVGGTGFSPPYVAPGQGPGQPKQVITEDIKVHMDHKMYNVKAATAGGYMRSLTTRFEPPGVIFCSRDLERGLAKFVADEQTQGRVPSDETLRARAREILGVDQTAADDSHLLNKFKALSGIASRSPQGGQASGTSDRPSNPSPETLAHDTGASVEVDDGVFGEFEMDTDLDMGMDLDMNMDLGMGMMMGMDMTTDLPLDFSMTIPSNTNMGLPGALSGSSSGSSPLSYSSSQPRQHHLHQQQRPYPSPATITLTPNSSSSSSDQQQANSFASSRPHDWMI